MMQGIYALTRSEFEREVDMTLDGSFPASDPPSWTLGAVEPQFDAAPAAAAPAATDIVISGGKNERGRRHAAAIAEAIVMAMLVPAGVLIVAAPFLLAAWAVAAAVAWLGGTG